MVTTFSDEVAGFARDLLRSLWAELGVEGAPRRHDWQAIDLEPLIVFTAMRADRALRAKTMDWCALNNRHVSITRLKRFSRLFGPASPAAVNRYLDTVSAPRRRALVSATPDLRRASLIQLRLRALFGVGARAEVMKLLLAAPHELKSLPSLISSAGYAATALAQALDTLTVAGVATATREGRRSVYRLNRPAELAQAIAGVPARFPDWPAVFRVVDAIIAYATDAAGPSRVDAAAGAIAKMRDDVARVPGASRPPDVSDEASVDAFERWARNFVAHQAGAHVVETRKQVTDTVHRLLLGGWIATVREEGDQPRPLALSDDPELRPERRARRRLKLDELGAAAEVIESILYDLRTRELQRRRGSVVPRDAVSDSLLPALSREFAAELLSPMHKGQAATFTEEFLQSWSANRRNRFTAAG
jgi:DNA-binding transcriptional ArsR family regulator